MNAEPRQQNLLAEAERIEKPWKRTTNLKRDAWMTAELKGLMRERELIVGRALRYLWNCKQRSCTSKRLAQFIMLDGRYWKGKERSWVLYEVRRALSDLRAKGVVDTKPARIGHEFLWRFVEAGTGLRPVLDSQRRAS